MDPSFDIDDSCFNDAHVSGLGFDQDSAADLPWEGFETGTAAPQENQQTTEDNSGVLVPRTPSDKVSRDDVSTLPTYQPPSSHLRRRDSNSMLDDWLTSLHMAASRGHSRILNLLLTRGGFCIDDKDGEGKTALHHATIGNHEACVRVLLEKGAKIDVNDGLTGWTSLHWAVLNKNEAILRLLLESACDGQRDFDVDAFDVSGWTPLHTAAESGFERGVELLLEHGADLAFRARRCKYSGYVIGKDVEDMVRAAYKENARLL